MTDAKRSTRRPKETRSQLKAALRQWAEADMTLRSGPKTFLMHLVHHANEDAEAFVVSKHFRRMMNVSPRTITNYLRHLQAEGYIARTQNLMIIPSAQLPYYRLAPRVPKIEQLLNRSEDVTEPGEQQPSNPQQRVSNLDPRRSNSCMAYNRNNSTYSIYSNSSTVAAQEDGAPEKLKKIDVFDWVPAFEALPPRFAG